MLAQAGGWGGRGERITLPGVAEPVVVVVGDAIVVVVVVVKIMLLECCMS